jgi:lipopolysaccharide transport system ATP-binding protein
MSSDPAIGVRNLSKVYDLGLSGRTQSFADIIGGRIRHPLRGSGFRRDSFHALDDLTFDVARGEVVGVIGKNGAGKSTLLKILSHITPPSAGYIDMVGTVGSLLEVGTGFHPELTGTENVYLNGSILGMSRREIDSRLEEITAFAEVDKFLSTPVKRYSSGMRVRLAFAVAAHLDPEILIIDEVLSVGDYGFQAKCLEKMRSVAADEGRTVLYVTHNLVNLEHLCPRSLLLVDGRLVFDGATADTLAKYLHTFPRGERGDIPGVFDLATHQRADDYADQLFTRLELRPGGGPPSDVVRMGESLQIEIAVQGLDAMPDANVNVTVGSSTTPAIFRMTCRMIPLRAAQERRPEERVVIDIPALPLTPGDYHLHVAAHDKREGHAIDEVRRAAEFTVISADVLGTGYQFSSTDGHVHIPWDWEVRPVPVAVANSVGEVTPAEQAELDASHLGKP